MMTVVTSKNRLNVPGVTNYTHLEAASAERLEERLAALGFFHELLSSVFTSRHFCVTALVCALRTSNA